MDARRSNSQETERTATRERLSTRTCSYSRRCGWLAATGGNRQPWEFIVVTDKGVINQLAVAAQWMDKACAIIAVVMDESSRGGWRMAQRLRACRSPSRWGYGSCWWKGGRCASRTT